MSNTYEPREDSFMLQKYVKRYARGVVLDIGTGSGIQALTAAAKARKVIAVEVDARAVERLKHEHSQTKIEFCQSDLFSVFKKPIKFDTIIFNPPYLPEDVRLKDMTVDGGKKGYEIIERFIGGLSGFLKPNGNALIVFSSLTNKAKVDEIMASRLFEFLLLESKRIFFEELYVYRIRKGELLKRLERNGLEHIRYFARGKRGVLYAAELKRKQVMVKTKLPESKAVGRIENEAKWLKELNKHRIGPRLLFRGGGYFVYEFVEGVFVLEFFEKASRQGILSAVQSVFLQLFTLDRIGVDKEEMHHPLKHIVIGKKPVLIDFERCHRTSKPKNVTQFCQFLLSYKRLLEKKRIRINRKKLIELAKTYKRAQTRASLDKIIRILEAER